MAAAEYFSNAPMSQQSQAPTSHPSHGQSIPQIQTPPPRYHPQSSPAHNVHFASTPVNVPQRHSFSGQQRPSFSQNSWNQSPSNNPYQQQNQMLAIQRPPQQFNSTHSSGYNSPQLRPQHLAPHMRPYANLNSSQYSLDQGYSSDPEPHRRRHKHRSRAGSESNSRGLEKSRSTNKDGFLGAAGGGLIGDLIFPGLGTIGGAALGYLGGKDYGRRRKSREDDRAAAQREWEAKHRPERHHHESRDYNSRDSSNNQGSWSRQRSYERRKEDYR